jgi:hypothetical protein
MRWKRRGFSRFRSWASIGIAIAAVMVLSAGSCGSSSSTGAVEPTEQPSSVAPPPSQSAAVPEPDCSDSASYPPVTFYYSEGTAVSDLTACTNSDQSQTAIENQSSDTVWYVSLPSGIPYWTGLQDLASFENDNLSPTAALFRVGLRRIYNPPALTIEPGVTVILDTAPGTIQLKQDPGEQATWEVASLLVDSSSDKAQDAIVSLLKQDSSETDSAMITCMSSGYSIGKNLAEAGDSEQNIQSQLSSELGVSNATNECGEAIDEAEHDSESHGEVPELKLANVVKETHEDPDYAEAGHLISDAEDAARDLLKVHE